MGSKKVRVEEVKPYQKEFEITTATIWIEDTNIEESLTEIKRLGIEHLHLQTNSLHFLKDHRLRNIKGITVQFKIDDLTPLYGHPQLTHLSIYEPNKGEFDFSNFPHLVFLGGTLPKKYARIESLAKLKFLHLFDYKKNNFQEFVGCKELKKIWAYSFLIENLHGLSQLSNLERIQLEGCRKLVTLSGLEVTNLNLEVLDIVDCKALKNADALGKLPRLKKLFFYNVLELDSLHFLSTLHHLEDLRLYPSKVGVKRNDYYPLIETLKRLNKLDNLKKWKPLKQFLDGSFELNPDSISSKSELQFIRERLPIMGWVEKRSEGLKQYTKKNCQNAQSILVHLITELEKAPNATNEEKESLIKNCVLQLNAFNNALKGCFIETGERDELCDLFDNIADAVGLNIQDYEDGIASAWRDW
jgi:hypothetical protein